MNITNIVNVIQTRDLTRHYGRTVGIEALDLDVRAGEVFGFLGPNGSGKTTTIRLLLDLIRPTRGTALLFGEPARPAVRARIGYLPGELALDARMTGHATLSFLDALLPQSARAHERTRGALCDRIGMSDRDLRRRVREYSRGMKQRLGLIAALQHEPDLLVLDEPTEGLDPLVRETVFELMRETRARGATVFHSSHVLSEVERTCDRVAILRGGRLVALMRVDEMRAQSVRRMVIEFGGAAAPIDALKQAGVDIVEQSGSRVVLRVSGPVDPIIAVLARHEVRHLAFPESNLEEAFAAYYAGDVAHRT